MLTREQIEEVVDDEIIGAVDGITSDLSDMVSDKLNLSYEAIRRTISEKYHCVTNWPKEVGVQEFLDHLVLQLKHKQALSSHKRLYKTGFNDDVKFIEKIIKLEGKKRWQRINFG